MAATTIGVEHVSDVEDRDLEELEPCISRRQPARLNVEATVQPVRVASDPAPCHSLLKVVFFVSLWYFFNVQYNIENKRLLKVYSAAPAVAWMQLAAGVPIVGLIWASRFVRPPALSRNDLGKLFIVAICFSLGQLSTVASLSSVAVSFTHAVKALEPAVNAIASALVLKQVFHPIVYTTLVPIFIGVAMASASEISFTLYGFSTPMASNFAFVGRNILATKFGALGDMGAGKVERKTNQLAILTMMSTCISLPLVLVMPRGLREVGVAWEETMGNGVAPSDVLYYMVTSGFYFFMYQLSSFWVLSQVPPITHSVLNTLKRCVVIAVSMMVFKNPVTVQNIAGTSLALLGVLLYSLTKFALSGKSDG